MKYASYWKSYCIRKLLGVYLKKKYLYIYFSIKALILDNLEENTPEDQIILKLIKLFYLTEEQAQDYFNKYTSS